MKSESESVVSSPKPKRSKTAICFVAIVMLVMIGKSLFTVSVDQNEKVAEFAFGEPVRNLDKPGLYAIAPWHSVVRLDRRYQLYDSDPHQIITSDKKALVTDDFAPWRVTDPTKFIQSVSSISGALTRIDDSVYSRLNAAFGSHEYADIVINDRENIINSVSSDVHAALTSNGIDVAMVLISRVDLPDENKEATYSRMSAERNQRAQTYRSEGQEEALRISSTADRDAKIILADAKREAEVLKGKGDAQAAQIYADAYSADPKFYAFVRGLEATEKAFGEDSGSRVRLILHGDEAAVRSLYTK